MVVAALGGNGGTTRRDSGESGETTAADATHGTRRATNTHTRRRSKTMWCIAL